MLSLPDARFRAVPAAEQASWLARAVRSAWQLSPDAPVDVSHWLRAMGWRVQVRPLDAPENGLQAAMAPTEDGFVFVADDRPTPRQAEACESETSEQLARALVNLRLAHELGHVFFYDRSCPAARMTPVSPAEEDFCDTFAEALVGPSAR